MDEKRMELTETDGAGNVIATYVSSPTDSIAGLLSSRAVLSSVGVGDATASPTAALLLSIFQDSVGRVATILFADRFGTALEPECKMYRLLADVLNDCAFVLDCLSPAFPKPIRVVVLSFSSVLRALCGVAAGSSKASLSAHFALGSNLGELNAKDSSQETVISLMGMLVGSLVVYCVTSPLATWSTLLALLAIHLETNRRAVRAVSMRTLNRQRATLVYHDLQLGKVPTPGDISRQERIFEWDGVLRNAQDKIVGYCSLGSRVDATLRSVSYRKADAKHSVNLMNSLWETSVASLRSRHYALLIAPAPKGLQASVVLERGASATETLSAWWQALAMANQPSLFGEAKVGSAEKKALVIDALESTATECATLLRRNQQELVKAGWDLDTSAIETKASRRVALGPA
ncbi:hypothetical protein LTR53_012846 [Teratosphaeriaceae sp. CCFEE 6253]|nr:hypothetical protein LTR53_012846 [Teratosphaeriaceae sp. CCFEE 6253]